MHTTLLRKYSVKNLFLKSMIYTFLQDLKLMHQDLLQVAYYHKNIQMVFGIQLRIAQGQ